MDDILKKLPRGLVEASRLVMESKKNKAHLAKMTKIHAALHEEDNYFENTQNESLDIDKLKERVNKVNDVHNHFQKESQKILAKHGFSKIHSENGTSVYHKGHKNGHSTLVRIHHDPNDTTYTYGSKFTVHSTNGSGTLNGHNHIVKDSLSTEENKHKAVSDFHKGLVDHMNHVKQDNY